MHQKELVVYAMCFHACAEEGHMFFFLSLSLSLTSRSLCVPISIHFSFGPLAIEYSLLSLLYLILVT